MPILIGSSAAMAAAAWQPNASAAASARCLDAHRRILPLLEACIQYQPGRDCRAQHLAVDIRPAIPQHLVEVVQLRRRRASDRLHSAIRIAGSVLLAGPASGQPVWLTMMLWPMNGWPRSVPSGQAAATNTELLCAPAMHRMLAIAI